MRNWGNEGMRGGSDDAIPHPLTLSPAHLISSFPAVHSALFLDRDGVIIENRPDYVRRWADVYFFPQALAALARIRHSPYKIIIVTNQSSVGRGIMSMKEAVTLNEQIMQAVRRQDGRIDATYICPDAPGQNSGCRKPLPGMLLQAAREHHLDLSHSIMIGDALSDVAAGRAAGVRNSAMVLTGRGRAQAASPEAVELAPFPIYPDLQAALAHLIV